MSLQDHQITLAEAAKMTKRFRELPLGQIGQLLAGVKAYSFSKAAIQSVLNQDRCESIRFYLAVETLLPPKFTIVAVGVDVSGNDLLNGIVLDKSNACPHHCSKPNELNS